MTVKETPGETWKRAQDSMAEALPLGATPYEPPRSEEGRPESPYAGGHIPAADLLKAGRHWVGVTQPSPELLAAAMTCGPLPPTRLAPLTDREREIVRCAEHYITVQGVAEFAALKRAVDLPKTPDVLAPGPHGDLPTELEHPANKMAREAMRREETTDVRREEDKTLAGYKLVVELLEKERDMYRDSAESARKMVFTMGERKDLADLIWEGRCSAGYESADPCPEQGVAISRTTGRLYCATHRSVTGDIALDTEEKLRLATEQVEALLDALPSHILYEDRESFDKRTGILERARSWLKSTGAK